METKLAGLPTQCSVVLQLATFSKNIVATTTPNKSQRKKPQTHLSGWRAMQRMLKQVCGGQMNLSRGIMYSMAGAAFANRMAAE